MDIIHGEERRGCGQEGQVPNIEGALEVICWVQGLGCCGKPKGSSFWGEASRVRGVMEVDGKEEEALLQSVCRFMHLY